MMEIFYPIKNIKILTRNIQRVKIFIKSLFFHIYSGFPKATQDEIDTRYSICLGCDMLNKELKQCLMCGCNINNRKIFLNKLAWADQKCPLAKWDVIKRNKP
ncbi:MAG: hypothetical protein WD512_14905, partial [Candidatus Paceibacterota bacterium]